MVLTVTEDTPADMLAGSMELLVQLPRDHNLHTQRVTVQRSTPMIDLLVQIATAHKLAASSYTLQAIGERGLVLPHQPNTPIGALDALQVKLLPKQGTFVPRKAKQVNQPFETTFRLQVHLPRNQLYVSRVSPKMNLGDILTEVCREKNLDRNKYELRHPANLEETLDLSLSLQDYHLQEVTLYAKQGRTLSSALSSQDIMALQRQEERRRQQAKQSVFGFMFKKSKESSLSTDSLGGRSASPARSDETGRSASPLQPPARPQRKRRPAPKPPVPEENGSKEKMIISHSRNSSDSSGYHEASVLSDNPESAGRLPETLPRRSRAPGASEAPRKLAHTSHSSKSLGNLAAASGTLGHGISNTSLSSAGLRKKRAAPPPPVPRPLSSAISTQALERIVDSEESLTSDMDPSKPPSDIGAPSKVSSDIEERPKANSDIGVTTMSAKASQDMKSFKANSDVATTSKSDLAKNLKSSAKLEAEVRAKEDARSLRTFARSSNLDNTTPVDENPKVENARVAAAKRVGDGVPLPKPRKITSDSDTPMPPKPPKRRIPPPSPLSRTIHADSSNLDNPPDAPRVERTFESPSTSSISDVQRPVANENGVAGADTSRVEDHENNSDSHISSEGTRSRQVEVFEILEEARAKQEEASSAHFDATGEQPCRPRRNNARRVDDAIASSEREKGVEDARVQGESAMRTMKSEVASDKRSCTVISTIPKCEHFDLTTEDDDDRRNMGDFGAPLDRAGTTLDSMTSRGLVQSSVEAEEGPNDVGIQNVEMIREGVRNAKRARMLRSMSKTNDFEINSAMKQKKHLSSNAEDITCALNLSLSSSSSLSSEVFNVEFDKERGKDRSSVSRDVAGGDSGRDLTGTSDDAAGPSQTDILLQKVSDTLSGTLPVPSSKETTSQPPAGPEPEVSNSQKASTDESIKKPEASIETKTSPKAEPPKEPRKPTIEAPEEKTLNASTPNMTISSQQDTSDYVSAVGEDLSITEWEYQLPAPPSAFRDSNSPVFDGYDTITLRSVEAFKEPVPNHVDQIDSCAKEAPKSHEKLIEDRSANELSNREKAKESIKVENEVEVQNLGTESKSCSKQVSVDRQKAQPNAVLKKEIISELENKIGSGSLSQAMNKETESRRTVDQSSTPRIAPTDNTLSNFTITTYRRQKSLNIFEEIDERQNVSTAKRTDDRFVNSFPTLARNRGTVDAEQRSGTKEGANGVNGECKKGEPKIQGQAEPLHRWQSCNGSGTERSNVQRSKSYLSAINGAAHHRDGHGGSEECRNPNFETSPGSKTAEVPRSNEKFSQWRENILKRQEEPTKEKQLQSLQVLKSILPQLKSAQQAEENVSKEYSNAVLSETIGSENASNEHSVEANVVSTRESQGASVPEESRERHEKRYTYAGPPAISLGSWSERPTVSVQIKMDTDYKLGSSNGAAANNKTVVNIGSMKAEKNTNSSESFGKTNEKSLGRKSVDQQENSTSRASVENKVTDGPTKKFITHTTASGFKKPTESKVSVSELKSRVDDRPIVTGVELKKNAIEAEETSKSKESAIDTTPLNFKELTKAFGQDICLRPKPKRLSANRFSDCYNAQSESIQQITDINNKQNGYASSEKIRSQADIVSNNQTITNGDANKTKLRKFTSIVGIHPSNQNYGEQNGDFSVKNTVNIMKSNPLKPVAKGFKTADAKLNGIQISQNGLSSSECPKKVPQPPKPPTMPVITGVTLKSASARPKSMPVQIDPRDVLLESIRNFGGRQNLKSAAERY